VLQPDPRADESMVTGSGGSSDGRSTTSVEEAANAVLVKKVAEVAACKMAMVKERAIDPAAVKKAADDVTAKKAAGEADTKVAIGSHKMHIFTANIPTFH
jgi:hypothetical protein